MVIVTIVMIIAALAAPGMMRSMADSRAQRATGQLARLGRQARAEAQSFGRAYVLAYSPIGGGRMELWRGLTDSCRTNPWPLIVTPGACSVGAPDCVDMFDADAYTLGPTHRVTLAAPPSTNLCFEPGGEMYVQVGATFVIPPVAVRMQVDHFDEGVSTTVPVRSRFVVFPVIAAPRVEG